MILSFHPCFSADRHILLADRPLSARDRSAIDRAEAILLPQEARYSLFEACRDSGKAVFPNYEKRFAYPGKRGQASLFARYGFPHPRTLSWKGTKELRERLSRTGVLPHPFPFLLKEDLSHEGAGVHWIPDPEALERTLATLGGRGANEDTDLLTQDFVPCGGDVLRTVILGRRVLSYWKRSAPSMDPITTIGLGAAIDAAWRPDLQGQGREEAARFRRETGVDLAALDWVFSREEAVPAPLLLEINYYFGRRGLGGSLRYYRLLHGAIREWLVERGLDPGRVTLV